MAHATPPMSSERLKLSQVLWTLLILALTGNMIANAYAGNPSIINFTMFCAVFALLSLLYLTAASLREGLAGHPLIVVGVDALNTLFFFCAAVALAKGLGVHKCGNHVCSLFLLRSSNTKTICRSTSPVIVLPTVFSLKPSVAQKPRPFAHSSSSALRRSQRR